MSTIFRKNSLEFVIQVAAVKADELMTLLTKFVRYRFISTNRPVGRSVGQPSSLSYLHLFCMAKSMVMHIWHRSYNVRMVAMVRRILYAGLNVPCDTQSPI